MPESRPSTVDRSATFRILDANANRAAEGLRVVEDYLRFCRQDRFLSQLCKQIRHDMSRTLPKIDREKRLACRSTETDVGTATETQTEYDRSCTGAVAIANLHRVKEALRTLEEYAKLLSKELAESFESLRYRVYTLEKAIGHAVRSRRLLDSAKLYVLVDLQFGMESEFRQRIESLLEGGVDVIQLRDKTKSDREIIAAAQEICRLTQETDTLLVINDRPDITHAISAHGVHVGQDELSVSDSRRIVGPDALVGVSTHSIEQARQAVLDGADYVGIGPLYESTTKRFDRFVGLPLVKQVIGEIGLPAFAIGGITADQLDELLAAGIRRVAVSGAIWLDPDPRAAAKQFRDRLDLG